MKKIVDIYWCADDGTRFDNEDDCIRYEETKIFNLIFENLECYDANEKRLMPNEDNIPDDIFFIRVKGSWENETNAFIALCDYLKDNGEEYQWIPFAYKELIGDVLMWKDHGFKGEWLSMGAEIDNLIAQAERLGIL